MSKFNLTVTKKLSIVLACMFSIVWAADNSMSGMDMSSMDMSNMKGMSSSTHSNTKHKQVKKHSASSTTTQK
ncbi:MAG: hypothetical protein K2Y14_11215 [Burkholderiales bacterium]|jgi:hypothetical protein|nr:hypothetical protein [Burkholderiales bacterium]